MFVSTTAVAAVADLGDLICCGIIVHIVVTFYEIEEIIGAKKVVGCEGIDIFQLIDGSDLLGFLAPFIEDGGYIAYTRRSSVPPYNSSGELNWGSWSTNMK